jgi:hypothetical protein
MRAFVICRCGLVLLLVLTGSARAQDRKVSLRENYQVGDQYQVTTRTDLTGVLNIPGDPAKKTLPRTARKTGTARSSYDERVLAVNENQLPTKTIRSYQTLQAQQKLGDDTTSAQLRGTLRNLVLQRDGRLSVTFSPDGPMLLGELEQVRTDIFLPRLGGLLPAQAVGIGQSWRAEPASVQELTDLEQIQTGELNCTLQKLDGNKAVVQFVGQVGGVGPQGFNRQTMQGSYHFDLQANRLTLIQFEVTSELQDRDRKPIGNSTASYKLERKPAGAVSISTSGLTLDPTEDNTLLLVQEPRVGLEMVHSRRWVPRPISDKHWAIDGPSGSGLTIQFEAATSIPDAEAIRKNIEATLGKTVQGMRADPDPTGWNEAGSRVQRLVWRGMQNGKEFVFEYFLWKQAQHGAIVAARYFAPEATQAQKDTERMIRSLKIQ